MPQFETFERIVTQRALVFQQQRLLSNFTRTAEQRYEDFIARYPSIAARVPQYMLASYLGFSTEYLSRIRKRKADGN